MSATTRPLLRQLARRLGVVDEYLDQTGRVTRQTTDATREALLAVMGFDAPTEDAAAGWLAELDHELRATIIEPVRVVQRDAPDAARVRVRLPRGLRTADVALTLVEEAGHVWRLRNREAKASGSGRFTFELPTRVPYGYHHIEVVVRGSGREWRDDQSFIVTPDACASPATVLDSRARGVMGVVANLYSVRRESDWGVGDTGTLAALVEWGASRGAAFVGVNPLHALFNRGMDVSPYSPVSRLFRNHIYVDVAQVPELAHSPAAQAMIAESSAELAALRAEPLVEYERVMGVKDRVLTELHRAFVARAALEGAPRAREYAEFTRGREPELTRYATWMAIAEGASMPDWRQWPEPLRDPESDAVRAFQDANAKRVDYYRWLQFELHRQMAEVARRAHVLGMPLGVYQDLAIGTNPGGSDTWSNPELFLEGASIGAPPDPYSATGQNWGLPPLSPRALRKQRYRYWIQLVRRAFEHAGALRIDHIMGLFRLFWIPDGLSGKHGAYVQYPSQDLLGILALESVRHNALVVGEDLGTVPKDVPPAMKRWGILSSRVLYFERDADGFHPASRYPKLSLATVNTHDMPTLAGFWRGADIALRHSLGLVPRSAVAAAERERERDKEQLLERVGLEPPHSFESGQFVRRLTAAVHEFLCSTPALLVGLSLDDLAGEETPVNVPGVGQDRYPSWRRRMRMSVEEIAWSFEVDDAIRCGSRRSP